MSNKLQGNHTARALKKIFKRNNIRYTVANFCIVPQWPNCKNFPALTFSFYPKKNTVKVFDRKTCRASKHIRCSTITKLLIKLLQSGLLDSHQLSTII